MASPDSELHAGWWPPGQGFAPGTELAYFVELHSVLLGLAGRLSDADLVQLRAAVVDEPVVVPGAIVTAAIDGGVALTRQEVNAIVEVARGLAVPGGESKRIGELRLTETVTDGGHRFVPGAGPDYTDEALAESLGLKPGVTRVWRAWRDDPAGPRRVFLAEVTLGTRAWAVARSAQQRLTELAGRRPAEAGNAVPTAEVFWQGQALPPYHQAALAAGELLWPGQERP